MAVLAHNLDVRRQMILAAWLGVSVGWIGDKAHQAGVSDHNPDARGIVHAIDPMVTGDRARQIVEQCLAHPGDLEYVIHNRVIWSRNTGTLFTGSPGRSYTGSDPHTSHVHISGKHGSVGYTTHTGTGYDPSAEMSTPTFYLGGTSIPIPPPPPTYDHTPGTRVLRYIKGNLMYGDDVLFVQRFLGCTPDKWYGPITARRVSWYEGMRGIRREVPYGIAGPQVFSNMGVTWRG